jgi:hypothetical protein
MVDFLRIKKRDHFVAENLLKLRKFKKYRRSYDGLK